MFVYYFIVLVVCATSITNGWETPSSNQYHIQTDEGPERYFRYQTDSGQYRKEKRLQDGTVVGTYAWIDDDGFLRQRDYIADNGGYRILKTKNVYVGRNVPVGAAIKIAKNYPAGAGTLIGADNKPLIPFKTSYVPSKVFSTTPSGVVSTTSRPYLDYSPNGVYPSSSYIPSTLHSTTPASVISTTAGPFELYSPSSTYIPSTTNPASIISTTARPFVDVSPNGLLSSTVLPPYSSTEPPVVEITPHSFTPTPNVTFATSSYYSSTPSPISGYSSLPPKVYHSTTLPPTLQYTGQSSLPPYAGYKDSQDINQNSLEFNPYVNHVDNDYRFHNGPTYPIDRSGKPYFGNHLGNGYDPQYPPYDGVSVTNDGFRYYIPRAYHEEQTTGDRRDGSFGYIDPFGIRRVIYYNTAPGTGFQHRKNNRYVGFDATPYDPRPY